MAWKYKKVLVIGATSGGSTPEIYSAQFYNIIAPIRRRQSFCSRKLTLAQGIGEALAKRFVQHGSSVIVAGRRKDRLDAFVEQEGSGKASAVQFDITKLDTIASTLSKITAEHEDLDCVFINSGIQRTADFSDPESVDLDMITQELTVNYLAPLALAKAVLPFLLARHTDTAIMFTTSGLALVPAVRCPNYCAAKAAMHHFALCLREQLKDTKVKVVEIIPPAVQTELHNETNQPDLGGELIGMALDEFTDEAFEGLEGGLEQIPVGMARRSFEGWEMRRQRAMKGMIEMRGGRASEGLKAVVGGS